MDRSILSGFLSIISTKFIVFIVGILATPLLVRLLTKQQYGDYAFLLSLFGIFMILVSAGVSDGVRKYIAEDREIDGWEGHVTGFYFRVAFVLSLVGAGILVVAAASGVVADQFGERFTLYFYLLAVLVVGAQFRNYVRRVLMGFGLERVSEPLKVLNKVIFGVVAVALAYLGYGVEGVLGGLIAGSLVVTVLGLGYIVRKVPIRHLATRTPNEIPTRELMSYNYLSIVLIFLLHSLYHVDVLMLQAMKDSVTVSNYKAALVLAEFLWFVPIAIQAVLVHSTSSLWSQGKDEEITRLSTKVTRYTFLLTALLAIGLAALARPTVAIYFGSDYQAAVTPLLLLLPGAIGFAVARPIFAIGQGKGKEEMKPLILATGTAAAVNLVLNAILIPRYGMIGAAISTSTGYALMFVMHLWSSRRVGFNPLADARLLRGTVTAVATAAVIIPLAQYIQNDLVALAVVPVVGLCLFVVCALLTGAIGLDEVRETASRLPDPLRTWLTRGVSAVR